MKMGDGCPGLKVVEEAERLGVTWEGLRQGTGLIKESISGINGSLHERAGWIVFRNLWDNSRIIGEYPVRQWLFFYLVKLRNPRPSPLHSAVLYFAYRNSLGPNGLIFHKFLELWNPANFTPEMWLPQTIKGKREKPFAVTALRHAYESIKKRKASYPPDCAKLIPAFEEACRRFPKDMFARYRYGKMLSWGGRGEEAFKVLKPFHGSLQGNVYYWADLSEASVNAPDRIALLIKAISVAKDEEALGLMRVELAEILADAGMKSYAVVELQKYAEAHPQVRFHSHISYRLAADRIKQVSPDPEGYSRFILSMLMHAERLIGE